MMTIKKQGKPENMKRKLSHAGEESEEEETATVAAEKTVARKKTKKKRDQSESHVAEEDSEDFLIAAYARLGLKGRRGKPENMKRKLSDADEESGEEQAVTVAAGKTVARKKAKKGESKSHGASEDSDEDEEKKASTKQSKSGASTSASTSDDRRDKCDRRTLFLKNLPGNCTARQIKALSKDIKHVRLRSTLTRIDDKTMRILYAYVSFASEEAAEKNFKLLEGKIFNGTIVTVGSRSQFLTTGPQTKPDEEDDSEEEEAKSNKRKRDNKERQTEKKPKKAGAVNGDVKITLHIGNLSKNTTVQDLFNLLSENSISVIAVCKHAEKNIATVHLEDSDDLENALTLNGTSLNKSTITVEKARPRENKEQNNQCFSSPGDRFNKGDDNKYSCTLFVKNLPEDATVDNLSAIFDTASNVRIPMKDGVHKGFGFVEFSDKESLQVAMSEKQGEKLNGSELFLDYGLKDRHNNSGMRGESKVLFVKNLSYDTDESSLMAAFDGAVSARIPKFRHSGKSRGFGFVDFSSPEAAADAFDSMNGQSIDGRQVTLDFDVGKGSGDRSFGRG